MTFEEAVLSGKCFRMTYPLPDEDRAGIIEALGPDHCYGNVAAIDPNSSVIRIRLRDGSDFDLPLKTFIKATCHLIEMREKLKK